MSYCVRKAGYLSTEKMNSKRVVALWNLRECLLWEETEAVPRFCPLVGSCASEEWKGGSQTPVSSCLTSVCCWVITRCCSLLHDSNNPGAQWLMLPSQECKKAGSLQMEMSPLALKGDLWWSSHWKRSYTLLRTIPDELPVCREAQNALPPICKNKFSLRNVLRLAW